MTTAWAERPSLNSPNFTSLFSPCRSHSIWSLISLIPSHFYLPLVSLSILNLCNWCNPISSFFLLPPLLHLSISPTQAHLHFPCLLSFTVCAAFWPPLSPLSLPGRRWRDRTQGTPWRASEWSRSFQFRHTLRHCMIELREGSGPTFTTPSCLCTTTWSDELVCRLQTTGTVLIHVDGNLEAQYCLKVNINQVSLVQENLWRWEIQAAHIKLVIIASHSLRQNIPHREKKTGKEKWSVSPWCKLLWFILSTRVCYISLNSYCLHNTSCLVTANREAVNWNFKRHDCGKWLC